MLKRDHNLLRPLVCFQKQVRLWPATLINVITHLYFFFVCKSNMLIQRARMTIGCRQIHMTVSTKIHTIPSGDRRHPPNGKENNLLLSVVVPTFNERDNVSELLQRLEQCLAGLAWEVIFVDDDSHDGTLDVLREICRSDSRVRRLHRIGRRGLASAVVEGVLATTSPLLAVMDCDLQHDETVLPTMLERLLAADCDLVVASRYMETGNVGNWAKKRLFFSRVATRLADLVLPMKVTDPMSGFFMIKRDAFDLVVRHLSNQGYKILLDILLSAPSLHIEEVPYTFRTRIHGESKLDSIIVLDYLMLLIDKLVGHVIPNRFIMFAFVGGLGLIVHMAVLATLNRGALVSFVIANSIAALAAMTFNFFVNNFLTYRDMRLKGFWPIMRGLLSFFAVCAIGTASNVGVAAMLFQDSYSWWLAGISGVLVGAVWNYTTTSILTWRKVPGQ
jgi:dolichol-phosphate mannosyltransferase